MTLAARQESGPRGGRERGSRDLLVTPSAEEPNGLGAGVGLRRGICILIVDDSASVRAQLRVALEDAFADSDVLEAADGLTGFQAMVAHRPDLVLCDLVMPIVDGRKFLALRDRSPHLANIPVILLTADDHVERKVELLDRGAADYVTKPFHRTELVARARVHLRLKVLTDALEAANASLATLATTDPLMGLSNRRHLDRLLLDEAERSRRYRTPLSCILVDVDRFKAVNDTHGHPVGDAVLQDLGRWIAQGIRTTDHAARYGGEEVCIVLPHTPLEGAVELAERLRTLVESSSHTVGDLALRTTISLGVSCMTPPDIDVRELLRRADEALYSAKRGGRNRAVAWGCPTA